MKLKTVLKELRWGPLSTREITRRHPSENTPAVSNIIRYGRTTGMIKVVGKADRGYLYNLTDSGKQYVKLVINGRWWCPKCGYVENVMKKPTCNKCHSPVSRSL